MHFHHDTKAALFLIHHLHQPAWHNYPCQRNLHIFSPSQRAIVHRQGRICSRTRYKLHSRNYWRFADGFLSNYTATENVCLDLVHATEQQVGTVKCGTGKTSKVMSTLVSPPNTSHKKHIYQDQSDGGTNTRINLRRTTTTTTFLRYHSTLSCATHITGSMSCATHEKNKGASNEENSSLRSV